MASQHPPIRLSSEEKAYVGARIVLTALLGVLLLADMALPGADVGKVGYVAAFLFWVLGGFLMLFLVRQAGFTMHKAMLVVLTPDLLSAVALTYLLHPWEDAFFPALVLIPVMYALVVTRREAIMVGVATLVAYIVGHMPTHPADFADMVFLALKSVSIPLIGLLVANAVAKQRQREAEVRASADEKQMLNEQLGRRLTELQAVAEITELVHSSLDFDRVGPVVLDIVSKVIGINACCVFVIDKAKSETLFSASVGRLGSVAPGADPTLATLDDHFACLPIFDHGSTMVLFCASAEEADALTDEDRLVLGAVASELVVAVENSRLYKLTKRLAITDELTDLHNYRYLQQRLDEELERAKRYDKSLTLLMIDVDDFKAFNDTYGHIAGDGALSDLAAVLRGSVREVDMVARYGGEEFSIVLPETDSAGGYIVAEKVREAVAHRAFLDPDGEPACSLTVSIGLASYPSHAWDKESLLREADDALYNAKGLGKNRVKTPVRRAEDAETGE